MIDQLHQRWYTKLVFNLLYSGDLSVLDSNWKRIGSDLVLVGHCCAVSIGSVRVLEGLSNNHSCVVVGGRRCVWTSNCVLPHYRPLGMSITF